jgi:hypothetical protein
MSAQLTTSLTPKQLTGGTHKRNVHLHVRVPLKAVEYDLCKPMCFIPSGNFLLLLMLLIVPMAVSGDACSLNTAIRGGSLALYPASDFNIQSIIFAFRIYLKFFLIPE